MIHYFISYSFKNKKGEAGFDNCISDSSGVIADTPNFNNLQNDVAEAVIKGNSDIVSVVILNLVKLV